MRRAALAAAVLLLLVGCGEQQEIRDLENITQTEPDKVRLVTNVNLYPNVVALCIEGAGFITTTRDYAPIERVESWDRTWCADKPNPEINDGATLVNP